MIGAGAWGTALARLVHVAGGEVCLWGRDADALTKLASTGRNERYLPGTELPTGIPVEPELDAAIDGAGCVVLALPSSAFRGVTERLASSMARRSA